MSLRDEFPGLYAIASFKDALVVDVWDEDSWDQGSLDNSMIGS